ncbi:branched-chain amino acid ABC transporter substrate-binding protein [Frankia sp. Mgl5]|uniref:branched-chain amino acid ABC transporter substrate-binding protein n=1 Tax=Frankia sp. Mgl5 TaxID=2933793 RepID=UPI00200D3D42|nr:branched-chain amino acid ABC transporter substrate-binding protein [Frankia sp. Mgl5]MCK9926865.1 branched-chain amino acid ABC transporter substrate-binding protein [Frankia sp. Mgl5]
MSPRDPDPATRPERATGPDAVTGPDAATGPEPARPAAGVTLAGWVRPVSRAVPSAARRLDHWARRSARDTRGRVILAAVLVLVLAVPTGLGLGLAAVLGGAGSGASATKVATIGVMAPLSGGSADAGVSVRDAVTLAVEEANRQGAVPGWKLEVAAHDDLARPDGGAAGADLFADDSRVIGVVGPLSSSVAMVSLDGLSSAGIPVISPSNAEPTLTAPETASNTRPYPTYFRLSGTDELLAQVTADYAVNTLGRSRISVVDGGPDYGTITLADRFARHARDAGATVPTVHRVDGASTAGEQVRETAKAIQDEAPDLVYLATGAGFAGELRGALADEGVAVQVMGADGLLDRDYVERSDSVADGDVVADLSVPLSRLPAAGAFVTAYSERFGGPTVGADGLLPDGTSTEPEPEPTASGAPGRATATSASVDPSHTSGSGSAADESGASRSGASEAGTASPSERELEVRRARDAALTDLREAAIPPVAAYAYDAARALIRAAAAVLPGRTEVDVATRQALVRAVGAGDFAGVTGQVAFDTKGDVIDPRVVLYSVLGGNFVPLQVDSP